MSTLKMRQEILELINNEDDTSLKQLYKIIKTYKQQRIMDKMIYEGEKDIKNGNLHNMDEIKKLIDNWNA